MTVRDLRTGHPLDAAGDPLTLNVAGLMGEPPGAIRELELDGIIVELPDDLRLTEPVAGRVRMDRTNRGLIVEARLSTALAGECARCLRPLETPIRLRIESEVLPSIDIGTGLAILPEEGEDPEVPRLTDHHELELRPLIVEEISLNEPIAPLCEPDCSGLCVECGERMTPGHAHADGQIDPRLEALRAFRVDGPDETG